MKIRFKKNYILVVSPTLVKLGGRIFGVGDRARAGALFPVIYFKDESYISERVINHELIHFRQELETLFIGVFILTLFENFYARVFLKKNKFEAYKYSAIEQEAYLNQDNPNYLKERKLFAFVKYIKNKKEFEIDKDAKINIL